ncbi:Uncharacterised protein [Enterobacter asburiae]|nr:Uncharacterised protein [Enterobacter asburiae]SAD04200.1 Uncharacterised protein [Enterobacter hormaechei]SAF45490.1 Uncharacterised protein [Enterobacter asburiae]SAG22412.1 Uncharacterised protein [Enterobacter asburiae]SAH51719.1 Uncharacterised protein [Enterobacter asburiae]
MFPKTSGDFFCSFTAYIVVVQAQPNFLEAIEVMVFIFNPLLFGPFATAKGNRQGIIAKLRKGHAINLTFAQNYQAGVFIQSLPAKQTWFAISFSHNQFFAVWPFGSNTFYL